MHFWSSLHLKWVNGQVSHRSTPVLGVSVTDGRLGYLCTEGSRCTAASGCTEMMSPHRWIVLWSREQKWCIMVWRVRGAGVLVLRVVGGEEGKGWGCGIGGGLVGGRDIWWWDDFLSWTYLTTSAPTESKPSVCLCVWLVCVLMHREKCPHLQSTLLLKEQIKVRLGQLPFYVCVCVCVSFVYMLTEQVAELKLSLAHHYNFYKNASYCETFKSSLQWA